MFQIRYNVNESNLNENLVEIKKTKLNNSNEKKNEGSMEKWRKRAEVYRLWEERTQIGDSKPAQLPQWKKMSLFFFF